MTAGSWYRSGVGAGIGAIFGAPLGGAVLAASIIYRDDFEYRTLYPGFVTSATAFAVFGSFLGFDPMFGYVDAEYRFEDAWPLLWFVALGVVAARSDICMPASSTPPEG